MNLGQMVFVVQSVAECRVVPYAQMDGAVIYPSSVIETVRSVL
jgi:hypothetical protein